MLLPATKYQPSMPLAMALVQELLTQVCRGMSLSTEAQRVPS